MLARLFHDVIFRVAGSGTPDVDNKAERHKMVSTSKRNLDHMIDYYLMVGNCEDFRLFINSNGTSYN